MSVTIDTADDDGFRITTGEFTAEFQRESDAIRLSHDGAEGGLALAPGGGESGLGVLRAGAVESVAVDRRDEHTTATVAGHIALGQYYVELQFPHETPGLVDYRLAVTTGDEPVSLPTGAPELRIEAGGAPPDGGDERDSIVNYLDGRPDADTAGGTDDINEFLYFGAPAALDATLLAAVDYGALDELFATVGATMFDLVAAPPGQFGYAVPSGDDPIPPETTITVSSAVLRLEPGVPAIDEPVDYTRRFVRGLADVYDRLSIPETERIDWRTIAVNGAQDLDAPTNRNEHDGTWHPGGVELVSAMSVVNPYRRYDDRFNSDPAHDIASPAEEMLPTYHDPEFEVATGSEGVLANTPESSELTHADTWYYFWGLIQVGEFARETRSRIMAEAFLDTADVAVDLGRAFDYEFPSWIDLRALEGLDSAGVGDSGYQYDCTGAYVYLMLQYYDVDGDERYLREAEAAADRILEMGFEYPFELTTTALGPVALYWLYDETGDERYLDGVFVPLASVLRHAYFFDPDYGEFAGRRVFLLNSAMSSGNYYANAVEEDAMLFYLDRLLETGYDDLGAPVRDLVGELLRHKGTSLVDSLAPLQPDPSLVADSTSPQSGRRVNREWWLPLEPFGALGPDFDELGGVGQTLYGAGAFATAALMQYHDLTEDLTLYTECAVEIARQGPFEHEVRPLGGDRPFHAALLCPPEVIIDTEVRDADGDAVPLSYDPDEEVYTFELQGGQRYRFRYSIPRRSVVVEDLEIDPATVAPGDEAEISARFRNTSQRGGRFDATVQVGDDSETRTRELDGGDTTEVRLTVSRDEPGDYMVKAQRTRGRLRVETDDADEP